MRKQIAAANWKMNLTLAQGEKLLDDVLGKVKEVPAHHEVVFAVPFPYLPMAKQKTKGLKNISVAAQNCSNKKSGAYTGEVSVDMLVSLEVNYVILGHSERREYFQESNQLLAEKLDICLAANLIPIFCCGESLLIREAGTQNEFVGRQLAESLFH
jgi:triosephosphate isomerase